MTAYFFDSSALVKRYNFEPGSSWVRALCDPRTHPPLYVAQLAQVEVTAALRRTGRHNGLHPSFVASLIARFERHLVLSDPAHPHPIYRMVPLAPSVLDLATLLCNRHWLDTPVPLRSLDAIQLAAALLVARVITEELIFVTADVRLSATAPMENLRTINPLYPPQP